MSAIERAAELGAEHGRRDAKAWWDTYYAEAWPRVDDATRRRFLLEDRPEPDLSDESLAGIESEWLDGSEDWSYGEIIELQGAFESAYREAVETTIRGKVTP